MAFEKTEDYIGKVNSLLRGELSAVETYEQCIGKLSGVPYVSELTQCLSSHQNRVEILRKWIIDNGGQPAQSSGLWGAFAKLIEGSAKMFGERSALAALEEGEDQGMRDYRALQEKLSGEALSFIQSLVPEQQKTHETLSSLKKAHV